LDSSSAWSLCALCTKTRMITYIALQSVLSVQYKAFFLMLWACICNHSGHQADAYNAAVENIALYACNPVCMFTYSVPTLCYCRISVALWNVVELARNHKHGCCITIRLHRLIVYTTGQTVYWPQQHSSVFAYLMAVRLIVVSTVLYALRLLWSAGCFSTSRVICTALIDCLPPFQLAKSNL